MKALHQAQEVSQSSRTAQRAPERLQARNSDRPSERRLERPANRNVTDDGRFSIDLNAVPPGFVMEWKRHQVMGMEDKQNQVRVRQFHWEPVTHKMQPQILGHLCTNEDQHIMVDGMGLYMRPVYLNDDAMAEARNDTDYQLSQQIASLRMSSADQVGKGNTFIKKSTVAVPQPIE